MLIDLTGFPTWTKSILLLILAVDWLFIFYNTKSFSITIPTKELILYGMPVIKYNIYEIFYRNEHKRHRVDLFYLLILAFHIVFIILIELLSR